MAFNLQPPDDDGLFIPEVGPWSADKHHFLRRYIDAFTTAMHTHWPELHYIDLFAGAGIERIKDNGLDWGSPLIAAQSPVRFTRLHLCELRNEKLEALQARLTRFAQPQPPQMLSGDANALVHAVIREVPQRDCLSLAFLDPYGLDVFFNTLDVLSRHRVDLIIFFPDYLDANRNIVSYALNPQSNLDAVLGNAPWRETIARLPRHRWADALSDLYVAGIKTLGYRFFEYERISNTRGQFLYRLIFCSKHRLGAHLWRQTSGQKPDGQRSFDFD